MKEITECIGDIGRANSIIFSTLDLTSGFLQMQMDEDSQPLTAFMIPGKGQYDWVTSPMGLLGCPASFQWLMETVLRNINNVLVYIDDVLLHTATHHEHLQVLFSKGCIKTPLKLTWTYVFLATGRSLTLVLCSHLRA
jgi:hypothetical protein